MECNCRLGDGIQIITLLDFPPLYLLHSVSFPLSYRHPLMIELNYSPPPATNAIQVLLFRKSSHSHPIATKTILSQGARNKDFMITFFRIFVIVKHNFVIPSTSADLISECSERRRHITSTT